MKWQMHECHDRREYISVMQKSELYHNQCDIDILTEDFKLLGFPLSEKQIDQMLKYYEMLIEWNQVMNLTAITEYADVVKKHFVDSISIVKACDVDKFVSVIDVGTGAGFPGLVLKIVFPDLHITLLDSLHKRVQFLNHVIEALHLCNVRTIHGRAEDYAKQDSMRENFDLCVSRAVANLSTLSEYCIPFVRQGGMFISYKSEKVEEEVLRAADAITVLGGRLERQVEFMLPNSDIYRKLILIRKEKATPSRYPRKAGLPGKEPL